ncbi:MAG: hypothetical protein WBF17_18820 [Phycisphaerae bacterium]
MTPVERFRITYVVLIVFAVVGPLSLAPALASDRSWVLPMVVGVLGVGFVIVVIFTFMACRCPHCGRFSVSWGTSFCPKCGKRVDVEVTKSDADEQGPSDDD